MFAISILLYWPSLEGQAIWDDHAILAGQASGQTFLDCFTKPFLSYFRPGAALSFLLDRTLYGQDIFGYHFTNLLLHALASVIVAWLALLLFKQVWPALAAGFLFAIQPAQVGAVAWVGGRIDVLSTVLVTLFACFLIRYRDSEETKWIWLAALALLSACLVKEQNLAFLLLVPLVIPRRHYRLAWPIGAAALVFIAAWILLQPGLHKADAFELSVWTSRFTGAAVHSAWLLSGLSPRPLFTFSIVNYALLTWLGALLLVCAIAIPALLSMKGWLTKSGNFLLVGFALAYLPISNIVPIPSLLVGPYRLAVAGVFVAVGVSSLLLLRRARVLVVGCLSLWSIFCLKTDWSAIESWRTELGFFSATYRADPHSLATTTSYIAELLEASKPKEARLVAEETIAWAYGQPAVSLTKSQLLSPAALQKVDRNEGGNENPRKALARLFFLLSAAQASLAEDDFKALQNAEYLDPKNADVLAGLGDHFIHSEPDRGIRYYERSVLADPHDWENLRRLAKQRLAAGRIDDAIALYERTVQEAPLASIAWYELSIAYEASGNREKAIDAMEQGLKGFNFDKQGFVDRLSELRSGKK